MFKTSQAPTNAFYVQARGRPVYRVHLLRASPVALLMGGVYFLPP